MPDIQALAHLCSKVEALAPGSFAGITISSSDFTHIERALFPTLPYSFSAAITHVPLEPADFGSCVKAISAVSPLRALTFRMTACLIHDGDKCVLRTDCELFNPVRSTLTENHGERLCSPSESPRRSRVGTLHS
jgi:hypothetical protein